MGKTTIKDRVVFLIFNLFSWIYPGLVNKTREDVKLLGKVVKSIFL